MTTKKHFLEIAREYIKMSRLIEDKTDINLTGGIKSRLAGKSTHKVGGTKGLFPDEETKIKTALGELAEEIKLSLEG